MKNAKSDFDPDKPEISWLITYNCINGALFKANKIL